MQAHAEKERDELRADKANWIVSSAKPETQEGADAEKEALVKARDEALAQTKVCLFLTSKYAWGSPHLRLPKNVPTSWLPRSINSVHKSWVPFTLSHNSY